MRHPLMSRIVRAYDARDAKSKIRNVASGLQNALQASQPRPVSQASKNCFATAVIESIEPSLPFRCVAAAYV